MLAAGGVLLAGWITPARLDAQGPASPAPAPATSPAPPSPPPPAPSPSGSPAALAAAATNPVATPTPPAGPDALVNALNPGELQEAINLLRANYIRPGDVDDRALARATLAGLLARFDNGAMLLPKPAGPGATPAPEQLPDAFASEILNDRVGYVRFGTLTRDHLGDFDRALKGFRG